MYRNWTTDEDAQLLEMLRLNCHRTVIAAALDRTDEEIRARIGMLKALRSSGGVFGCISPFNEFFRLQKNGPG